jgi:hypothetical protein
MKTEKIQLFHCTRLEKFPSIMKHGLLISPYEEVTYFTNDPVASWYWMKLKYQIYPNRINFNFGVIRVEIDNDDSYLAEGSDHSNLIYSALNNHDLEVYEYSKNLSPEKLTFFHIFDYKDSGIGLIEYNNCFNTDVNNGKGKNDYMGNDADFERMLFSGINVIKV